MKVILTALLIDSLSQFPLLDFELNSRHIHGLKVLLNLADLMDLQEQVTMFIERSKAVCIHLLEHLLVFVQGWLYESSQNC